MVKLSIQWHRYVHVYLDVCVFLGQGNGAVKLYRAGDGSHRYSSGVVQVYYGRSWGSVCASTWTATEADVVCHQLGWQGAMNYGLAADEG